MVERLEEALDRVDGRLADAKWVRDRLEERYKTLDREWTELSTRSQMAALSEKHLNVRLFDAAEHQAKADTVGELISKTCAELIAAKDLVGELEKLSGLLHAEHNRRQFRISQLGRGFA